MASCQVHAASCLLSACLALVANYHQTAGVKSGSQSSVVDLAWGTSLPDVVVALMLPATLRFVQATTGVVIHTYSLAQGAVLSGVSVNRCDQSCFALTSAAGSLVLATVTDPKSSIKAQEVSLREAGPHF
jgi:hypothetical protein